MRLKFKKDENSQISVFQVEDSSEHEFSYIDMIMELIKSRRMEEPEVLGDFTEAETKSIKSMVGYINKHISEKEGSTS